MREVEGVREVEGERRMRGKWSGGEGRELSEGKGQKRRERREEERREEERRGKLLHEFSPVE